MAEFMAVAALVLGMGIGLLVASTAYAFDLRRMAAFLQGRNRASNARVTLGSGAPGLPELARAVNDELDAAAEAHVAAERSQAQFRRDLSALSHDIRTPLMGARGFLELATDEPDDPAERRRLLGLAALRLDDVGSLLDQLFAYTRASDPDLVLDLRPLAVAPLVAEVLVGHYPEFERRGWEPVVRLGDETALVDADGDALRRVLENLVGNALRHGAGAPTVKLCATATGAPTGRGDAAGGHVATDGRGELLLVVSNPVADVTALDVSRLFERFYQADAARSGAGAGLGLSVAARLAEAMGMRIGASMDEGQLAITLRMPLA